MIISKYKIIQPPAKVFHNFILKVLVLLLLLLFANIYFCVQYFKKKRLTEYRKRSCSLNSIYFIHVYFHGNGCSIQILNIYIHALLLCRKKSRNILMYILHLLLFLFVVFRVFLFHTKFHTFFFKVMYVYYTYSYERTYVLRFPH